MGMTRDYKVVYTVASFVVGYNTTNVEVLKDDAIATSGGVVQAVDRVRSRVVVGNIKLVNPSFFLGTLGHGGHRFVGTWAVKGDDFEVVW